MILIILLIVLLILILFRSRRDIESFNIQSLDITKHIKLNKFNRIDSKTVFPPHPKIGESKCNKVTCPSWIYENAICYKCE
ncbi:hypothetical protein Indivirus_1_232 [Indivirus ILV1]|uniref:Uncharacterized protein n=1 Tax=Indivirus ILV1 TaxID=1977633 RepID=A0A1V0SD19_9VIRU|nr:hypothetical protein Indivirus_1_232 [Indivirus ILV1]